MNLQKSESPKKSQEKANLQNQKSAIVAIIGRPSVGKSTFLNAVIQQNVSIVSAFPQTTRNAIRGIFNDERGQLVFIDTPGFHLSQKKMNLILAKTAQEALYDADCILYILDSTRDFLTEEKFLTSLLLPYSEKLVVAVNKCDEKFSNFLYAADFLKSELPQVAQAQRIFQISAKTKTNLIQVLDELFKIAPIGQNFYPKDFYTDQDMNFRICEVIRGQAIVKLFAEIPHAIFVKLADLELRPQNRLWIRAFLCVERESQKCIVIGKNAEIIKSIRIASQKELRKFFSYHIDLDLQVKVEKNWRQKDSILKNLLNR